MLQIAIAFLYITFLCWTYGYCTIFLFTKLAAAKQAHQTRFSITCMAGLSTIAVIAGISSLFIPLGGLLFQLLLLLAGVLCWIFSNRIRRDFCGLVRQALQSSNPLTLLLLTAFVLLMLVMNAWIIIHPDTLGYHAQTIQWIESYKAIPGLAHLHIRYGLQSNWYLLCALFSLQFTHTTALTFINTCLACWFLLFVTGIINDSLKREYEGDYKKLLTGVLFLILLAMSFWDFGQLRLTVVSASPDFAAGLYVWLVFFLLANKRNGENEEVQLMCIFYFSIIAITIKLSSVPVLLISCYVLYRLVMLNRKKSIFYLVAFASLAIIPFVTRNLITSGYAVFPLTFFHIPYADWKVDEIRAIHVKQYVTAYARVGALANMGMQYPDSANNWAAWLPVWWGIRTIAEKTMLLTLLVSLCSGLVFIKRIFSRCTSELRILLCVSTAGIVFWFLQAPDPRFGYGFIIPFEGMLLYRFAAGYSPDFLVIKRLLMVGIFILTAVTAGYTLHRLTHFFRPENIITPNGISPIAYRKISYHGILFNVPYDDCECGSTPLPCAYFTEPFLMRGKEVKDGFKSLKRIVK